MKLWLCLLLSAVCSISTQDSFAQAEQKDFPVASLVGKWDSGFTEHERVKESKNTVKREVTRVLCNACPEVNFKTDSTAIVTLEGSDETLYSFSWGIRGGKLQIKNPTQDKNSKTKSAYLSDGLYAVTTRISSHPGLVEVLLTSKNGTRQILRRSGE